MELLLAALFMIMAFAWGILLAWPGLGGKLAGRKRLLFWVVVAISFVVWLFFVRMLNDIEEGASQAQ